MGDVLEQSTTRPAPDRRPSRSATEREKPFQPAIGREFEVEEIEAKTRGFVAKIIVSSTAIAIVVAGVYWLIKGIYAPLSFVWGIGGPFIGAIVGHYFGPKRTDTG